MRAIIERFDSGLPGYMLVVVDYLNGSTYVSTYGSEVPITSVSSQADLVAATEVVINAYATSQSFTLSEGIVWPSVTTNDVNALIKAAAGASSYQTIVSQTGTSAPAVSGGFTPINTYSGTPTFTWARTGAGVYTITASSAVFNTSGKTGVFIQPLTNLNASIRGVVTSSTVITVTTAIQSIAILGLLPLTATNTDALLSNTMIYIQTYS